jgi:hypothetical protein
MRSGWLLVVWMAVTMCALPSSGAVITVTEFGFGRVDGQEIKGVDLPGGGVEYTVPNSGLPAAFNEVFGLTEKGNTTSNLPSDIVQVFMDTNGNAIFRFYSDSEGTQEFDPADVPQLPPLPVTHTFDEVEFAPGIFGARLDVINPNTTPPTTLATLQLVSDIVPEPASIVAWSALGVCALCFGRGRRRGAA